MLIGVELPGPVIAETRGGTPWHAHHIAERYGLLTIIALGEGSSGRLRRCRPRRRRRAGASMRCSSRSPASGSRSACGGHFIVSAADLLHAHRERSFGRLLPDPDRRGHRRDRRGLQSARVLHRAQVQAGLCGRSCSPWPSLSAPSRLRLRPLHYLVRTVRYLPSVAHRVNCGGRRIRYRWPPRASRWRTAW